MFGVGVTERVGQTVLVADFLTVGLGLRGAAFTLRPLHTERRSISSVTKHSDTVTLTTVTEPAVLKSFLLLSFSLLLLPHLCQIYAVFLFINYTLALNKTC